MNHKIYIFSLLILIYSCELKSKTKTKTKINFDRVDEIEFLKGYPEKKVHVEDSILNDIKQDLILLKSIKGPIKYIKPFKIILKKRNLDNDTILSNGVIFQLNNDYFKSKQNLFKKHNIN